MSAPREPSVPDGSVAAAGPVCGSDSERGEPIPGWGEWRICRVCTLEFSDPLTRDQDAAAWFSDAYRGDVTGNDMTDFRRRVDQRRVILDELGDPTLWFWTPAFDQVLTWLEQTVPPGSTVLDVGCGLGFFLHALRRAGFNAVGLDVADAAVELNRRDGFEVWQGPIETMPPGWQNPAAVVSFFVIHHLAEPRSFVAALRERAPGAVLAIASYGPSNKGEVASLPPRTLVRWNARALDTALRLVGYTAELRDIPSTGTELRPVRRLRELLARTAVVPPLYSLGKAVESRLLRLVPTAVRADAFVVLALARPEPADG
jgi:SAM-dependent methyltransferase